MDVHFACHIVTCEKDAFLQGLGAVPLRYRVYDRKLYGFLGHGSAVKSCPGPHSTGTVFNGEAKRSSESAVSKPISDGNEGHLNVDQQYSLRHLCVQRLLRFEAVLTENESNL
jgi:hypothetical protein